MEHGITFGGSDSDGFNLVAPIAGSIKDAQIKGNPAVLRSMLGLVAASRAAQGGAQAFEDATKYLIGNMYRSMAKKIEIEILYGQAGYGTVASTSGATITVDTAEWAPGIWAGAEGMPIEIRDATLASSRGVATVVGVNFDTRVLTLSGLPAGTVATDVIFHGGAFGNEFIGIDALLRQQTGTLFNIPLATNAMFRGNVFAAGSAPLSFNRLQLAVARAVERGHEGKMIALVNPRGWANLLSDQAGLRRFDGSYSKKKLENGSEALSFYSQNGEIEIHPSIYVKEGRAYLLSLDCWSRVGSTDITFNRPAAEGEFFKDLENAAGYDIRCYTDQAIFCSAPAKNVVITGIVNATS